MIKHKIALEGMEFFAYHGLYELERKEGNQFRVDIEIETDFTKGALSDEISGTLNYEDIKDTRVRCSTNTIFDLA